MTLATLLAEGWRDHDPQPLAVTERLETHVALVTSAADAQAFAALAAHAGGAHGGAFARAAALCAAAIARATDDAAPALAAAHGSCAAMWWLAGDVAAAAEHEMRAAAMQPAHALGAVVRVRMIVAEALGQQRRIEESRRVYESALAVALAEGVTLGPDGERAVAVTSNNIGSALLAMPRDAALDTTLLRAAEAARAFWRRCGTWENDERASYLLALAFNALGRHDDAARAAQDGLALIAAHGPEDVDAAFLTVQLAAAHKGNGDEAGFRHHLAAADAYAATFAADASLADWFAGERAKVAD